MNSDSNTKRLEARMIAQTAQNADAQNSVKTQNTVNHQGIAIEPLIRRGVMNMKQFATFRMALVLLNKLSAVMLFVGAFMLVTFLGTIGTLPLWIKLLLYLVLVAGGIYYLYRNPEFHIFGLVATGVVLLTFLLSLSPEQTVSETVVEHTIECVNQTMFTVVSYPIVLVVNKTGNGTVPIYEPYDWTPTLSFFFVWAILVGGCIIAVVIQREYGTIHAYFFISGVLYFFVTTMIASFTIRPDPMPLWDVSTVEKILSDCKPVDREKVITYQVATWYVWLVYLCYTIIGGYWILFSSVALYVYCVQSRVNREIQKCTDTILRHYLNLPLLEGISALVYSYINAGANEVFNDWYERYQNRALVAKIGKVFSQRLHVGDLSFMGFLIGPDLDDLTWLVTQVERRTGARTVGTMSNINQKIQAIREYRDGSKPTAMEVLATDKDDSWLFDHSPPRNSEEAIKRVEQRDLSVPPPPPNFVAAINNQLGKQKPPADPITRTDTAKKLLLNQLPRTRAEREELDGTSSDPETADAQNAVARRVLKGWGVTRKTANPIESLRRPQFMRQYLSNFRRSRNSRVTLAQPTQSDDTRATLVSTPATDGDVKAAPVITDDRILTTVSRATAEKIASLVQADLKQTESKRTETKTDTGIGLGIDEKKGLEQFLSEQDEFDFEAVNVVDEIKKEFAIQYDQQLNAKVHPGLKLVTWGDLIFRVPVDKTQYFVPKYMRPKIHFEKPTEAHAKTPIYSAADLKAMIKARSKKQYEAFFEAINNALLTDFQEDGAPRAQRVHVSVDGDGFDLNVLVDNEEAFTKWSSAGVLVTPASGDDAPYIDMTMLGMVLDEFLPADSFEALIPSNPSLPNQKLMEAYLAHVFVGGQRHMMCSHDGKGFVLPGHVLENVKNGGNITIKRDNSAVEIKVTQAMYQYFHDCIDKNTDGSMKGMDVLCPVKGDALIRLVTEGNNKPLGMKQVSFQSLGAATSETNCALLHFDGDKNEFSVNVGTCVLAEKALEYNASTQMGDCGTIIWCVSGGQYKPTGVHFLGNTSGNCGFYYSRCILPVFPVGSSL